MYQCLCACIMCTMNVSGALRGQKRVSDPLELELETAVDAGNLGPL